MQSLSRYIDISVSLVHTAAKIHGPRAKSAFLAALLEQVDSVLDPVSVSILHVDDSYDTSYDIMAAIEGLGISRIRSLDWDGTRRQRYSLLEHIRYELGQ